MFLFKSKKSGFTLLEMSVVIVIAGIVISTFATVLPSLITSSKAKKAEAILERFELALKGYFTSNGHLPCPDTNNDGVENRDTKGTDNDPSDDECTRYVGTIPNITLGITSGNVDAWNQPIKYGVYEALIKSTKNTTGADLYSSCRDLQTIIYRYDTTGENRPPDIGLLNTIEPDGTKRSNQAYVIVSGGPKNLNGTGGNDTFDGQNEGVTDVVFDTPNRRQFIDASGASVANNYDDIVRAVSLTYLSGQTCSGSSSGGSTATPGENSFVNGCSNTVDDDNDGVRDCQDPDCCSESACQDAPVCLGENGNRSQGANFLV